MVTQKPHSMLWLPRSGDGQTGDRRNGRDSRGGYPTSTEHKGDDPPS
ncbi:hypothetical protein [Trichothermofontia sp.]